VALGLNADDMQEVNSFIEQLKAKREGLEQASATHIKQSAEQDVLQIKVQLNFAFTLLLTTLFFCNQNQQLDKEVVKFEQKVDKLSQENVKLKAQNTELQDENKGLEKGMREILDSIKEQSESILK
jgi:uncharacterized protein YlxW (UPF0749 family)